MYRIHDNPDSRFPPNRLLSEDTGKWQVAHLKSRREKAFAIELAKAGIGYFLPLYEKRTRRRDNNKIRKTIVPLFPGYVAFVKPEKMKPIFKSSHFVSVIKVANQNAFVKELSQIQRILDNKISFETHDYLCPGKKVRVLIGPLSGMEGVIIKRSKKARLYTAVDLFNQSVSIEIQEGDVESL